MLIGSNFGKLRLIHVVFWYTLILDINNLQSSNKDAVDEDTEKVLFSVVQILP